MFHVKEGLFFERQDDGSVRIMKRESANVDTPEVMDITMDKDAWASVIATMSYYDEDDYGYYRACEFHSKEPVPDTCPLKDKPKLW